MWSCDIISHNNSLRKELICFLFSVQADLAALFTPRQPPMPATEAQQLMEEWNEDLEAMESFVLEGKKFVRLPEEELGNYNSCFCIFTLSLYLSVFILNKFYFLVFRSLLQQRLLCFPLSILGAFGITRWRRKWRQWTWREASPTWRWLSVCCVFLARKRCWKHGMAYFYFQVMGHLKSFVFTLPRASYWEPNTVTVYLCNVFPYSLQKKFKSLFGDKLEVVRTHQQQENLKFMAHFKRRFIIHTGRRKEKKPADQAAPVEFYQLRSNGSALYTRLVQVKPEATTLNSAFWWALWTIWPFDSI